MASTRCQKCGREVPETSRFCLVADRRSDLGSDGPFSILRETPIPRLQPTPRAAFAGDRRCGSSDSARRVDPSIARSPDRVGQERAVSYPAPCLPAVTASSQNSVVAEWAKCFARKTSRSNKKLPLSFSARLRQRPAALERFHAKCASQGKYPIPTSAAFSTSAWPMTRLSSPWSMWMVRTSRRSSAASGVFHKIKESKSAADLCRLRRRARAGPAASRLKTRKHPARRARSRAHRGFRSGEYCGRSTRRGNSRWHACLHGPRTTRGRGSHQKSDIYALGLVLYEIFTGKRAYDAPSAAELMRLRESSVPVSPISVVKELDPLIERVIQRCLERDPARRPSSALQVAAALPGGDPLAAALAAGETPSPEMVAAAGSTEGLRPLYIWSCVAIVLFGLLVEFAATGKTRLYRTVGLPKSPDVLTEHAQNLLREFGYTTPPEDTATGFDVDGTYLAWVDKNDKSPARWQNVPGAIKFWYRQSPGDFNQRQILGNVTTGRVSSSDPPHEDAGMVMVMLESSGTGLNFCAR